ncbi:CBS domain-containing protein [Spirochaetota bacterium]
MTSLAKIIARTTSPVVTIKPTDMVSSAVKLMADRNIGALLVMDGQKLVGILSERDLVRKLLSADVPARSTPVSAIMTKNPFGADPKKTVEACVAMMSEHRFRHLPVLDDADKVVGMVSMGDLVSDLVKEQAFMLEQFERYVATGTS